MSWTMEEASPIGAVPAPEGFLASVRAALAGTAQDYTQGNLSRAILLLAIPMVVEMGMEALFGIVDIYFVGGIGPNAVATVGLTEAVLSLHYALGMGMAMAGTSLVARRIGEGDREGASKTTAQALWLTLGISIPLGVAGALGARFILHAFGATPAVVTEGRVFTTLMLSASGVILLLFVLNGVLRGAGDAAAAMRVLLLANGINLILDPCLIRGLGPFPKLGLTGAAVATTIGRSIGVGYQLLTLLRGRGRVRLTRDTAAPDVSLVGRLLGVAAGGAGQAVIGSMSWVVLAKIVAPFGSEAMAGYTVAIKIVIVALLPAWGMGNAAATLVGQNLGAGQPERAEAAVWRTGLYNAIFLGCVAVLFIAGAEHLVLPFTKDPLVIAQAVSCLRTLAYGYVFYAYGMVMLQAFNGAGDTWTPTIINVLCFWAIQSPLAYVLARPVGWGPRGVFVAIAVAQSLSAVLGVLAFRRGRWKLRRV